MPSKYFTHLAERLDVLKKVFLPAKLSPTGNYKSSTYEKARAFKVLTCAELEYYFEEIAFGIANATYKDWNDNATPSKTIIALVGYYSGNYPPVPELKNGNYSRDNLQSRINSAFSDYASKVKSQNHGIKEKNILQLLLPIGFDSNALDDNFLIAANNYGTERGNIAHSTRATQCLDPQDAKISLDNLMQYVQALDSDLCQMCNLIEQT